MTDRAHAGSGVRLAVDGPVATVTLDSADNLNAQTPHTWAALREIGRTLLPEVRVVLVRAEGRAFSAGLDRRLFAPGGLPGTTGLAELAGLPAGEADAVVAGYQEAFAWLGRGDLVSVAAVQGHAVGAGFQLALACDLRVLAADALLCMAETTLGLVPDLGGTHRLVALVGYSRAMEICLTGRRVSAPDALQLGLATLVVPGAELADAVGDLVAALLVAPRDAVAETKALLLAAAERSPVEQAAAERAAQLRLLRARAGGES